VITDRYTTSNAVHQAEKLPENERDAYVKWLFDFEYGLMGLPRPDLVLYLDMPVNVTEKMMAKRRKITGEHGDIHENDREYLNRCRSGALKIAENEGWHVITCAEGDEPRSAEDIHREILNIVMPLIV
jgi:dTMP kinase